MGNRGRKKETKYAAHGEMLDQFKSVQNQQVYDTLGQGASAWSEQRYAEYDIVGLDMCTPIPLVRCRNVMSRVGNSHNLMSHPILVVSDLPPLVSKVKMPKKVVVAPPPTTTMTMTKN